MTETDARRTGAPPAAARGPPLAPHAARPGGARGGRQPRPREGRQEVRPVLEVPFPAFARPYVRGAITDTVRARARRESLGDGTYADVIGFPDITPQGRRRRAHDYEPPDPGPGPHELVESLERLRTLGDAPRARAHRARPHDRRRRRRRRSSRRSSASRRIACTPSSTRAPPASGSVRHDLLAGGDPRRASRSTSARPRSWRARPRGRRPPRPGARLFLSSETVKSYRKRIIAKLGARNGTHAVALALRSGLLPLDCACPTASRPQLSGPQTVGARHAAR